MARGARERLGGGRRGLGDRDRRAGRRDAGEAGRARVPVRGRARRRARARLPAARRPGDGAPRAAVGGAAPPAQTCHRDVTDTSHFGASVAGSERLRLFCALACRTRRSTASSAGRQRELHGGRIVPPRTCTSRSPSSARGRGRGSRDRAALGRRRRGPPASAPLPGTARRGASGCSPSTTRAAGTALAGRLHEALEELGVYRREERPWLPHLTVLRFRERPRLQPVASRARRGRPSDAAVYISGCVPVGRSTTFSKQ